MNSVALEVQTVVDVDALDTAKPLAEIFQPYQAVLTKWEAKVQALVVTDIGQKTEMAQARLARLELKQARVTMDKTRVGLVGKLKERTSKIDGVARVMREKFEELEGRLLDSEEFADRHAAQLKAELKAARESELIPFLEIPLLGDLSDLTADQYAQALSNAKLLKQAKIDAAVRAEAEAKAKAEADRVERERIAAENARLKAEAIEAARLADVERKRVEAERAEERRKAEAEAARLAEVARKERESAFAAAKVAEDRWAEERRATAAKARMEQEAFESRARANAEASAALAAKLKAELAARFAAEQAVKAKAEAEAKATALAARRAAAATDLQKLLAFTTTIRAVPLPSFADDTLNQELLAEVSRFIRWINNKAQGLS